VVWIFVFLWQNRRKKGIYWTDCIRCGKIKDIVGKSAKTDHGKCYKNKNDRKPPGLRGVKTL